MEFGNIAKADAFKNFFHLSYKNTQLFFFVDKCFLVFS